MKKIILTTAISALLSTSAFAGGKPSTGDIDFDGSIVNPSCEVTLDGGNSFKVSLGEHQRNLFGSDVDEGPVGEGKIFSITATGFDCNKAELTLQAAEEVTGKKGVFLGANSDGAKLAFILTDTADKAKAVAVDGSIIAPTSTKANTVGKSESTYEFKSYLYNQKTFPELGNYTAKLTYTVVNP